jgi:hypothetical protein
MLADGTPAALREAGATFVAATLAETRAYLLTLTDTATVAAPAAVA